MSRVKNFAKGTVSGTYGAGDTSITLTTGHGSRFLSPATDGPFPVTWWNSTDYADPSDDPNREICLCTARSGDVLTLTRGQEGTSASTKNTASKTYKIIAPITESMWNGGATLSQTFRGLSVQNHADANLAASRAQFSAGAIVLSDGEEVANWSHITLDLAASGIGGLDSGTEQNSTWYELYAAYNGATKSGFFHRAKGFLLDEDITAGEDASQGIRSATDNSTVKVSQGFQNGTAGPVPFIDVKLLKTGAPTGYIWFTIEGNASGAPNNTPLATSVKLAVARLTTTATQVRIPFPSPASLSAATQYHVVAQGDWSVSATNYVNWRMDGSAATYANGNKALFDSDTSTWATDVDDDMWLRVYVTENDVAVSTTAPSGYKYALIGYAYNDGSGNLASFLQYNTTWRYADLSLSGIVVNELGSTATLVDLRSVVPPLDMLDVVFGVTGTGAAGGGILIGDYHATDVAVNVNTGRQAVLWSDSGNEEVFQLANAVMAQSCAMIIGTAGCDVYVAGFTW